MVARLLASPPDLLVSLRSLRAEARADMPRAMLLASLVVATLFAAIGASRPWWPAGLVDIPIVLPRTSDFSPPPSLEPPGGPEPTARPAAATIDPHVIPNAVPFAPPTDIVGTSSPTSTEVGPGPSGPVVSPNATPVDLVPVAEPVPDIWDTPDVEPEPLFTPKPVYTDLAQQANVEGTVVLRALVERDGRVGEIRVERSVPLLDEAAKIAIARWTFTPARTHGVAVRAWVLVPVRFSLRDAH